MAILTQVIYNYDYMISNLRLYILRIEKYILLEAQSINNKKSEII